MKNKPPQRDIKSIPAKKLVEDYIYRIDLDADYQREKIWSKKNQEELLDSIIKNIDIPKLYLARVQGNENFEFECIDGKQRMLTLLAFYKPESGEDNPLTVSIAGERLTYKQLQKRLPPLAKKIDDFELTFVIYPELKDEEFIREIFRRLQLGVRLNSGELLKTYTGALRDFVYKEMGREAPFLRHTNLSEKRFSRQFTLAQICINSFARAEGAEFVRARYDDLGEFFKAKYSLEKGDGNLERIRKVLRLMDKQFGVKAQGISSRAVAVTAYLFCENLYVQKQTKLMGQFVKFYITLLDEIGRNLKLLSSYKSPENTTILDEFQKYISQASVEPYAIKRRNDFLEKALNHYRKTGGKVIAS